MVEHKKSCCGDPRPEGAGGNSRPRSARWLGDHHAKYGVVLAAGATSVAGEAAGQNEAMRHASTEAGFVTIRLAAE